MPRPLPDEMLEEVLFRLPPHEPANLVRAALVSRRWRRLVSGAVFRRRFREFHRSPPVLGMLYNYSHYQAACFVPTAAFCPPEADRRHWRALDARHGRVLLHEENSRDLVVWDPITDEERMLQIPPYHRSTWSGNPAVLCAGACCDHLDCHRQPFVVVYVGSVFQGTHGRALFICT